MNAVITLASNLFGYLIDEDILKLGKNCVEHVRKFSIVTDVFYHMSDSDFRHKNGEMVHFIVDTSDKISNTIGTKIGNKAGNNLAKVIANVKNANQRSIRTNENNNEGF